MYKIEFSNEASLEYTQIWQFISMDNLFYANEVLNKIDYTIDMIANFPFLWHILKDDIRRVIEPKYKFKIVYKIQWNYIFIISIFKYKNIWE
jgi:hypothetical protein